MPTKDQGESTVHLDIEPIGLDGLTVRVYDCAEQVGYRSLGRVTLGTPHSFLETCAWRLFSDDSCR